MLVLLLLTYTQQYSMYFILKPFYQNQNKLLLQIWAIKWTAVLGMIWPNHLEIRLWALPNPFNLRSILHMQPNISHQLTGVAMKIYLWLFISPVYGHNFFSGQCICNMFSKVFKQLICICYKHSVYIKE